jgi:hypothetical protein
MLKKEAQVLTLWIHRFLPTAVSSLVPTEVKDLFVVFSQGRPFLAVIPGPRDRKAA